MKIHEHHARRYDGAATAIAESLVMTSAIAWAMLFAGILVTTVLPTCAPIWMGFAMMISKK